MTTGGVGRARRLGAAVLVLLCALAVTVFPASPAHAFWTAPGTTTGTAVVATLPPVSVTATSPPYTDRVEVSWSEPAVPSGMAVDGYRVLRDGRPACGLEGASPLPASARDCIDAGLPDGPADYTVEAVVGSWTTSGSATVTVAADRTGPGLAVRGAHESNALVAERDGRTLLFFRPADGGTLRLVAEATDAESGPGEVWFPEASGAGWDHAAETVADGSGEPPTLTFRSSPWDFRSGADRPAAIEVTATDRQGNASRVTVEPVIDDAGPTGGRLVVGGGEATAGGSQATTAEDIAIAVVTPFAEDATTTQAGSPETALTRESAPASAGACGVFGSGVELPAAPGPDPGLPTGCYRYTLTGTDAVGNTTRIRATVLRDTSAPESGALTANGTAATPSGTTTYTAAGTWPVTRTDYTDPDSAMATSVLTRSTAALSAGSCGTFGSATDIVGSPSGSAASPSCTRYVLRGTNAAGLASDVTVIVAADAVAPTGGAFTVNGTAATSGGATVTSTTGSVTLGGVTAFGDAHSGIDTTTLTRATAPISAGTCGAYGSPMAVDISTTTVTGLADGCHRFTLTGTDRAGNVASVSVVVRVDASAPTGASLTVNGGAATSAGATAGTATAATTLVWSLFSDAESGMASALLQRTTSASLSNGVCGTPFGSAANVTTTLTPTSGTTNQTLPTAARCYRYVLSGTNGFGLASNVSLTLLYDLTAPATAGNLTVNAVNATTGTGSTSNSATGAFSVTALRTFTDGESGIASTSLVRTQAPLVANTCGTFDPASAVSLVGPAPIAQSGLTTGCYRYVQSATNGVGTTLSYTTTVRVDTTAPVGGALVANGTAATSGTGSQSFSTTGAWTLERTDFTDPETTVTPSLTRAVATSLSNGVCGAFGAAVAVTGAPAESGITAGCIRYVLGARNSVNLNATSLTTTVRVDTSAPTGGALTVNGVAASAAGTSSTSTTGTFTISVRTGYSDTQSGMGTTTLRRSFGPSCTAVDPATAVDVPGTAPIAQTALPVGCYRYELRGTNAAGGTAAIVTSVLVTGP